MLRHTVLTITITSRHTVPCHSEPPPGQQTVSRQGKHARLDLGIKLIKAERSCRTRSIGRYKLGARRGKKLSADAGEPESLIKVQIFTTAHTNSSKEAESNQPLDIRATTQRNFEKGAQIRGFYLVEKVFLYSPRVTLAGQLSVRRH